MDKPNPSSRDLDLALEALLGLRGRVVQIPDDVDAIAALLARVRAEARAERESVVLEKVLTAFVAGASWGRFDATGVTAFTSERDDAEAEAARRYCPVQALETT